MVARSKYATQRDTFESYESTLRPVDFFEAGHNFDRQLVTYDMLHTRVSHCYGTAMALLWQYAVDALDQDNGSGIVSEEQRVPCSREDMVSENEISEDGLRRS